MYNLSDIRDLHLEISSHCNARCPLCPRNLHGFPFNDGYIEHDMTLEEAKTIFTVDFVKQLETMFINGNFGDIVMNPHAIEIIRYFKTYNPKLEINISTNGGARDQKFWQSLAEFNCRVFFCIDGLEDTNHLYRQNVVWETVIKNAKTFIESGGYAIWQMIDFDFNQHQQKDAENFAKNLGFKKFRVMREGRQDSPVFDKNGNLLHIIGSPGETNFQKIIWKRKNDTVLTEDIGPRNADPINCMALKRLSIYVSSVGEVYPCCHTGFSPRTYGHGNYMQAANRQIKKIVNKNNALENSLEDCIKWFDKIEKSWRDNDFNNTRLITCQDKCGTKWRNNEEIKL